ncbi:riboflavin biosynthesis protein RibD [Chlamydia ibidis]|uniref:Riboflavin biosynthesis protein RibD n=2 Tax=Chlamydia ibidis TaxID=1405396 RepID=S7J324_9CHLA|nr:bifunctional diaminohydroxyphosphoribosylaminopyrimidine deaminase/5-amino-6-(5-phosphoribosylamino)uracil reductase RibD [Chlamydia ibidis]EPP34432.1 riboflavin biosynthesis protein RibD [Chlamydia ibidis]EQM62234.1 riboflavin biosynthesis protein RibD [Chlamydia ibidis 10-1398/6]
MEDFSDQQLFFMRRAIEVGEKGKISAPPNPWVGCVITKNNKIIGEGYHRAQGEPHAERNAIHSATSSLKGAHVYVTLEPCAHYGHTPPCVDLLVKSKVAAVNVAVIDPDERVAGSGIAKLRKAGIVVHVGVGRKEAEDSLRSYLYQREHKQPWVVIKTAASIDGQVSDQDGCSQWITCSKAREDVGKLRAFSQAVIAGADTIISDNPYLTARYPDGSLYPRQPLRVVLDSKGRVPLDSRIFHGPPESLYVTTEACPLVHLESIKNLGVSTLVVKRTPSGVDLSEVYSHLAKRNILQILVEGGSTLHTSFLNSGLVHSLVLYHGNKILGNQRKPIFKDLGLRLNSSKSFYIHKTEIIGNTLKTSWYASDLYPPNET